MLVVSGCATVSDRSQPASSSHEFDPIPGTVFIFDDGRVERFVRRDGDSLIWATRRGSEYVRAANPALPIPEWTVSGLVGRRAVFGSNGIWPPRGGSRDRFRVLTQVTDGERNRRYSQAWSCAVGEQQTVAVPAGNFSAYAINCDRYSLDSMQLLERRIWWWSPDLGHQVRRQFQDLLTGEKTELALCAALPELRASEARINALLDAC